MTKVRVVKSDDRNFGIEILKTYDKQRDGTDHPLKGQQYWDEHAYYGCHLQWALESAALLGMDKGELREVSEAFAKACKSIEVVNE